MEVYLKRNDDNLITKALSLCIILDPLLIELKFSQGFFYPLVCNKLIINMKLLICFDQL